MPEEPIKDWEWEHTPATPEQPAAHTMTIGGVLCRWWGDTPPPGVETLANIKMAMDWIKGITTHLGVKK